MPRSNLLNSELNVTFIRKIHVWKKFLTRLLNSMELWEENIRNVITWCAVTWFIDLELWINQLEASFGFKPFLRSLDFESIGVLHVFMFPRKRKQHLNSIWISNICGLLTKKVIIARKVKFGKSWLELPRVRNKAESLHIFDDHDNWEKKEAKVVLQEVRSLVTRNLNTRKQIIATSFRLHAKQNNKEEEEENKESKESHWVVSDI